MLEKYTNPTHILFSDEAWFHLRRYVNSYYSNRSRNANLHTDSASLRLVHGVEQVQLLLLSTFFSSDHKFISIFLTPFFENPSVCKRTYTSFQHDSATAHTGNSFMLFTQCLWWQNSEKRIVASLSAWSESIKLSARHWRWSEKKNIQHVLFIIRSSVCKEHVTLMWCMYVSQTKPLPVPSLKWWAQNLAVPTMHWTTQHMDPDQQQIGKVTAAPTDGTWNCPRRLMHIILKVTL